MTADSQPPIGATLDHPLPSGMRDLLPPESSCRREIAHVFLREATLAGYEIVQPPAFEYASTIERGLGSLDAREIVRFVEPESGEVVALRPDVTPQIARLCATRLEGKPTPYRLAYDASVVRRRSGSRARTHRQIDQLGVELIGDSGLSADLEPLMIAARTLGKLGLGAFTVDVGDASITRVLLRQAPPALAASIAQALAHKDLREVERLTAAMPSDAAAALAVLPRIHGDSSLLKELPAALDAPLIRGEVAALVATVDRLTTALATMPLARVSIDLGEVRDLRYYTGPFFALLAEGPGVPIGGGGRYDTLLARFGRPLPATGLALDVDALLWALRSANAPMLAPRLRVVVHGVDPTRFADALRARGIPAIALAGDASTASAYARAWDFPITAHVDAKHQVALQGPLSLEATTSDRAIAALLELKNERTSEAAG